VRILLEHVEELAEVLARMRAEVASLHPGDIMAHHIPIAQDELDAVVAHTATATETILIACEALDTMAAGAPGDQASQLQAITTQIYEACSFQDITGQRISKVVTALKAVEAKVTQILDVFGTDMPPLPLPAAPGAGELALLNGPQLAGAGMAQDDIDRLLSGTP
jgi:chemotaxis protein CheZ